MTNASSECNAPKYGRAYRAMTPAIQHQTKLLEVRNSEVMHEVEFPPSAVRSFGFRARTPGGKRLRRGV